MKHPTTNPLAFFIHALFALLSGAFVAGLTAGIQLIGSGTASLSALLLAGFSAFATYFGAGFVMLEKAPETKAALADAGQQVLARVDQLQQSHGVLIGRIEAALSGLRQIAAQPAPARSAERTLPFVTPGAVSVLPPTPIQPTTNAPAVPQQDFPALRWPGDTGVVPQVK